MANAQAPSKAAARPAAWDWTTSFFESVLVPQVMLRGFLGFAPAADGFTLDPRLPADWPELTIDRVRFQDVTLRFRVRRDHVEIWGEGGAEGPRFVRFPAGDWTGVGLSVDGRGGPSLQGQRQGQATRFDVDWVRNAGVRFSTSAAR
jgi:hypothetical protein